ncbi:MAG: hypothetical protein ACYS6K_27585 [Planctomycetota bacterium]|jgi:hypothetical protein
MITLRKSQLLVALIAACVVSAAYGQQSEKITTTSKWNQMSEEQRQFILKLLNDDKDDRTTRSRIIGYPFSRNSGQMKSPNRTRTYSVFGVSKEDVQKMAEAVIEGLDNQAQRRLERKRKELEDNKKKTLPKLEIECKQVEAKAQEKTKEYLKANYEINKTKRPEIFEHAIKNMEELARYMKLANFELIGLQARIDSIERFKASGNISDPSTLIKLDQMLIADEIERAGIMARRKAYEEAFRQTKELYDIFMNCNDAAARKLSWERKLASAKAHKYSAERLLANPPAEMQPVKIYENKVVIMQVKQN